MERNEILLQEIVAISPYNCYAGNAEPKASEGEGKFWGEFQSGKARPLGVSFWLFAPPPRRREPQSGDAARACDCWKVLTTVLGRYMRCLRRPEQAVALLALQLLVRTSGYLGNLEWYPGRNIALVMRVSGRTWLTKE